MFPLVSDEISAEGVVLCARAAGMRASANATMKRHANRELTRRTYPTNRTSLVCMFFLPLLVLSPPAGAPGEGLVRVNRWRDVRRIHHGEGIADDLAEDSHQPGEAESGDD